MHGMWEDDQAWKHEVHSLRRSGRDEEHAWGGTDWASNGKQPGGSKETLDHRA